MPTSRCKKCRAELDMEMERDTMTCVQCQFNDAEGIVLVTNEAEDTVLINHPKEGQDGQES